MTLFVSPPDFSLGNRFEFSFVALGIRGGEVLIRLTPLSRLPGFLGSSWSLHDSSEGFNVLSFTVEVNHVVFTRLK